MPRLSRRIADERQNLPHRRHKRQEPDDLRRLLESLRRQTAPPDEIIIVDASSEPVEPIIKEFPELAVRYLRHWPPSAAAQRNAGIGPLRQRRRLSALRMTTPHSSLRRLKTCWTFGKVLNRMFWAPASTLAIIPCVEMGS